VSGSRCQVSGKGIEAVELTVSMLEARRLMRLLFGADYARRVEPYRQALRTLVAEKEELVLVVGIELMRALERDGYEDEIGLAIAATLDEMENGGQ